MPDFIGTPGFISDRALWDGHATVGHGTCVGYPGVASDPVTRIGADVVIGGFCIVEAGVTIGRAVTIDHYCRVGAGTTVGDETKLLYGAQLFDNCRVGNRCIIGGNVDDRVIIEDDVTYMGRMAHAYRRALDVRDWDIQEQPSPVLRRGCVVGQDALIIGGIEIGVGSYVAAGEIVRSSVPAGHAVIHGEISPLEQWRGLLRSRASSDRV